MRMQRVFPMRQKEVFELSERTGMYQVSSQYCDTKSSKVCSLTFKSPNKRDFLNVCCNLQNGAAIVLFKSFVYMLEAL